ncbi:hypothetical protein [Lutibacter sp.]|uniref:hypothetical protein n=1 Tax=Lutibacter sp. TaxID=1925666 RepID=UPI002732CB4B|nr:hypothetical protein [Lutibacter sp.]MDP3313440.1 hypothetical protein [Lutibacter sp.]
MNSYKNASFLKLAIRFGLIFLVVISLIKIVVSLFSAGGFEGMIVTNFSAETWKPFVINNLIISLMYGLFMGGYYKFIKNAN